MTTDEKKIIQKSQRINSWSNQKLYYSVAKSYKRKWTVKKFEVYFVDLGENVGSEENKIRPVVVLQADSYNFSSPVFTCAIISTSKFTIPDIQIQISGTYKYLEDGVQKQLSGTIDLGQIKTIGKERIISDMICSLSVERKEICGKIFNIFGLTDIIRKKDNIISSLQGKCEYLQQQIEDKK